MTHDPLAWLHEHAVRRRAAGLRRSLRHRAAGESVIDLASNDYLGLAGDPRVIDGAVGAARTWGAGSTGSRLVTGSTTLHAELERELAQFCGTDAGLVFSSGYLANLGVLAALSGKGALIVSDERSHASLVDACRLSRARVAVAPHNDPSTVEQLLVMRGEQNAFVVTDSVSSVDGDLAPLAELHAACRRHRAVLVVDEAHGLGVCGPGGRGLLAELRLAGERDVVATVTLSKSLGAQGGAVLATHAVIEHLIDSARTFIFDTALAPPSAGAALAALRILRSEPALPKRVLAVAARLADAVGVPAPPSAVISVILGEPDVAVAAARECLRSGVLVGCFRPPSVPVGTSRLRLTAHAGLSEAELGRACEVLSGVLAGVTT